MIGDRRTCAFLDKQGNVVWYCPKRFDSPSFFASLLDAGKGGVWQMGLEGLVFEKRMYLEESALLQTHFNGSSGKLLLEDWMPLEGSFYGICRKLSAAPEPYTVRFSHRPNYGRQAPVLEQKEEGHATVEYDFHLYASHPLEVKQDSVSCQVPAGEKAWFMLA